MLIYQGFMHVTVIFFTFFDKSTKLILRKIFVFFGVSKKLEYPIYYYFFKQNSHTA